MASAFALGGRALGGVLVGVEQHESRAVRFALTQALRQYPSEARAVPIGAVVKPYVLVVVALGRGPYT